VSRAACFDSGELSRIGTSTMRVKTKQTRKSGLMNAQESARVPELNNEH